MILNYIWIMFFTVAFVVAAVRLVFFGDLDVFSDMMKSTFDSAEMAFDISLGITGALAMWLGLMKIAEKSGVIDVLAKVLAPLFTKLFPEIPKGHPATGSIFMNLSANMLGLDNAATPLGLKAMEQLQELNPQKNAASNPMIMFLVLNTSSLTLIPVTIFTYRAKAGAVHPTDVFIPIIIATMFSTLAGIIITSIYQKINLFNRTILLSLGGIAAFITAVMWGASQMDKETLDAVSTASANIILMTVICGFVFAGAFKKINVYDAFIEGAKEGFTTAIKIIPFLVAVLVSIGVFRTSGAMQAIIDAFGWCVEACGVDSDFVAALPTAMMKPLSGSGARTMMVDAMKTYGADSFVGRLSCIFQGSTDTTFYILAVYFGSVSIRFPRHAITCGLFADAAGILAAIIVSYVFFG